MKCDKNVKCHKKTNLYFKNNFKSSFTKFKLNYVKVQQKREVHFSDE